MPTLHTHNCNKNLEIVFEDTEDLDNIFKALCASGDFKTFDGQVINCVTNDRRPETYDAWIEVEGDEELEFWPWIGDINTFWFVGRLTTEALFYCCPEWERAGYEVISQDGDLVHFKTQFNRDDVMSTFEFISVILVADQNTLDYEAQ